MLIISITNPSPPPNPLPLPLSLPLFSPTLLPTFPTSSLPLLILTPTLPTLPLPSIDPLPTSFHATLSPSLTPSWFSSHCSYLT